MSDIMNAHDKILPALLAARGEFLPAKKESVNPHFKSRYADLKSILDACQDALSKHGIAILNVLHPSGEGCMDFSCMLLHVSGQRIVSSIPISMSLKPQEFGSALTYYRRYLLAALLSLATEDDDAEAATRPARPTPARVTPAKLPANGSGPPTETWPAFAARFCTAANDEWRAEMAMANVPTEGRKEFHELLVTQQLTNRVCTRGIELGLIDELSISKIGAEGKPVRDKTKVPKAVADLYATRGKGVKKFLEEYRAAKEHEARIALGMALADEGEIVPVDASRTREPGQEG